MRTSHRSVIVLGLLGAAGLALAACAPDPAPSDPAPTEPDPVESSEEAVAFTVPSECESAYGEDILGALEGAEGFPLNDPSLTMASTEVERAAEVLDGVESLRCTWGMAGEVGIATTIAEIGEEDEQALRDALAGEGFECTDEVPAVCSRSEAGDDEAGGFAVTETHLIGAGGWVATQDLNAQVEPDYSASIAATLWD